MRLIAVEEAFALPGTLARQPLTKTTTAPRWTEEWARRLTDLGEGRLADMDAHGVDVQVLSLTVPGIQAIDDALVAVNEARKSNDHLAQAISAHPDRFRGFAAVPLQDPEAAADELRRAVETLGFCGALVNDHTLGHYYDEPRYDVFWSALEELDVPLYLHPGAPPAGQWHLLKDHPELVGPLWTWGAETGGHALRLIFGGVFDRHPRARLLLGHMGEFLPFQAARLDSRYLRQKEQPLRQAPSRYLGENVLITVSGVWSHTALRAAVDTVGAEAVLFAVDYPFEHTKEATDFLASAPLSGEELRMISHLNAERVLRLPR